MVIDSQVLKDMDKIEKQEIVNLLGIYKFALNSGNARLAQSLFSKDSVFMPSEGVTVFGLEEIYNVHKGFFSKGKLDIEIYIEEIEVDNEIAFAVTSSENSSVENDLIFSKDYRELIVFEKLNGAWRIARFMYNKSKQNHLETSRFRKTLKNSGVTPRYEAI